MEKRSPIVVLLLGVITCGIYALVWYASTRGELVRKGADIPTTWLFIVPFVGLWYLWKYAVGSARVAGKYSDAVVFVLLLLLGPIGQAVVQASYNEVSGR